MQAWLPRPQYVPPPPHGHRFFTLNSPVFTSLIPVILFIAIGFYVGRRGWIRAAAVKDLANLVFMVLTPALLFRTMSTVHIEDLNFGPVGIYFVAFGVVYTATLAVLGFTSLGAARALANTFSNTLMIGVPLVGLVFGDAGLVTLFTLISVHSLILLTAATVVFELAAAREHAGREGSAQQPMWRTVLQAVRNGIVHPVPLAFTKVGHHFKAALRIALVKCVVHPIVLATLGWALGLSGMPLAVMIVAASLPVGANVFLFAQRYAVAEDEVTASVAVSTALALVTMPVVILAVTRWVVG